MIAKLSDLVEPFAERATRLAGRIVAANLPLMLFEARRSFKRTQELFGKGRRFDPASGLFVVVDKGTVVSNARAGESPHNWGLAADFVLDETHGRWAAEKMPPPPTPWDTKNELALYVWAQLGELARDCDLAWGGDFASLKDLPHVEMPNWQRYRPANWKEIVVKQLRETA